MLHRARPALPDPRRAARAGDDHRAGAVQPADLGDRSLGALFFAEYPDVWSLVGVAVIAVGGLLTLSDRRRAASRRCRPIPHAAEAGRRRQEVADVGEGKDRLEAEGLGIALGSRCTAPRDSGR